MMDGSAVIQYVFQIHGPASKDCIREVVDVIRQKNQILRTRMVRHHGILYQVVVRDTVDWYEGTNLSEYRSHVFSRDGWIRYGDPLYRYAFIKEGRDLYFTCTAHHSGYDRWSHRLMFDALQEGLRDLEALRQRAVQVQYKRFSRWLEHRSEATDRVAQSMAFWKSYLDGSQSFADRFEIALDHKPYEVTRLTKIMPLTRRAYGFALSTMALAAWAISLGVVYQQKDILFISAVSGRQITRDDHLPKIESIIGPLATAIYLRTRLRADQTIECLLRDAQDNILATIPYQRESLKAGAELLDGQATYPPFFNWHPIGDDIPARVIDFENQDGSTTRLEGRRDLHTPLIIPTRLGIDVWEHHDHLRIDARWDEKLYTEERVVLIMDHLTHILSRIAASKAQNVGDLWSMRTEGQEGSTTLTPQSPIQAPKSNTSPMRTSEIETQAHGTRSPHRSLQLQR